MMNFSCKKRSQANDVAPQPLSEKLKVLPSAEYLFTKRSAEYVAAGGIMLMFGGMIAGNFVKMPDFTAMQPPHAKEIQAENVQISRMDVDESFILVDDDNKGSIKKAKAKPIAEEKLTNCTSNRADIVDRHGALLATNMRKSHLTFHSTKFSFQNDAERKQLAEQIAMIIPTKSVQFYETQLKKSNEFVGVAGGLSTRQVQQLKMLDDRYAGLIKITERQARVYPKGAAFSSVIGNVKGNYCGLNGLESTLNADLQNHHAPVQITLDERMQFVVQDALFQQMQQMGASMAAGVLIEVATGKVRAQVSLPTIDENQRNYLANSNKSLMDKYSKDQTLEKYELGSVFKVYNTALAIERGISVHQMFETLKPLYVGGHRFTEPHPERWNLSTVGIFIRSNNIGSVKMALEAGHEAQTKMLLSLGLGDAVKFQAAESKGPASVATRSYGYGLNASPMETAVAMSSVLNGGVRINPVYLEEQNGLTKKRVFSESTSDTMRQLLLTNVTNRSGTGTLAYRQGTMLGGKTGTAKTYVGMGAEGADKKGYLEDTITTFAGAFPMDNPKYVLVVTLFGGKNADGEPMNAGTAAAPVAGEIAQRISLIDGLLRDDATVRYLEEQISIPYKHEPLRVAQN